jgi:hypothetical protein
MHTAGSFNRRRLGLALLVAALLLFAETTAATHELKHTLQSQDDLSCQLHLFADHFAKTPAADTGLAPLLVQREELLSSLQPIVASRFRASLYRPRAPPVPA